MSKANSLAIVAVAIAVGACGGHTTPGMTDAQSACREWNTYQASWTHEQLSSFPTIAGQAGLTDANYDAFSAAQANGRYTALSQDLQGVRPGIDSFESQSVDSDCAAI
jgi:hypothetical protein